MTDQVLAQLDLFLRGEVGRQGIAGMTATLSGADAKEHSFLYGFIDETRSTLPTPDTAMVTASLSKSVTATLICLLQAEEKLSIQDPVRKYLPDFALAGGDADAVTVEHLLTHTSGIPSLTHLYFSAEVLDARRSGRPTFAKDFEPMESLEDILSFLRGDAYTLTGKPGEVMAYSNEGYALLSGIIDIAAGKPMESYLRERLLDPLGMTRTGYDVEKLAREGPVSRMFEKHEDGTLVCLDHWVAAPAYRGAANLISTSRDMNRYYRMMANGGVWQGRVILPPGAVHPQVGRLPLAAEEQYGYGLPGMLKDGHALYRHGGGMKGIASMGGLIAGGLFSGCVLINQEEADAGAVFDGMIEAALGKQA